MNTKNKFKSIPPPSDPRYPAANAVFGAQSGGRHTPGPWHIGLDATERAIYGMYGEHIATLPDMLASDEVLANTRLVAAAPELLSALQAIARRVPIMGSTGDYREGQLHALEACAEVAKAAITRATEAGK